MKKFYVIAILLAGCSHSNEQVLNTTAMVVSQLPIQHKAGQKLNLEVSKDAQGKVILKKECLSSNGDIGTIEMAEWAITRGSKVADSALPFDASEDDSKKEAAAYKKLGYNTISF